MANNRMYLVNDATGQRVLLAKRMIGPWYFPANNIGDPSWSDKLDAAFDAEINEHGAPWGSTSWRIEYEHPNDECERGSK
jgi:hypothetical protein